MASLGRPAAPTILRGVVYLTATAVDDEGVVGVQFRLNGRTLGDVTIESPVTKFVLSWNSRDAANGVYTLTAIARDAAGNTTESAGGPGTISHRPTGPLPVAPGPGLPARHTQASDR